MRLFGASMYVRKILSAFSATASGIENRSSSASLVGSTTHFCRILPGSAGIAFKVFTNLDQVDLTTLPIPGVGTRSADATSPALRSVLFAAFGASFILSRSRTRPSLPSLTHLPRRLNVHSVARSRTTYFINFPAQLITGQIKTVPISLTQVPSHFPVNLASVPSMFPSIDPCKQNFSLSIWIYDIYCYLSFFSCILFG